MDALKLLALDEEDLGVVSAHVQDAVFKVAGIAYDARRRQFTLWSTASPGKGGGQAPRLRAAPCRPSVQMRQCRAVARLRSHRHGSGARPSRPALRRQGEGPEGTIELVLAGEASIALDVECIEVQLADTGGAWETAFQAAPPEGA